MFDDLSEWKHILYVIVGGFIARLIYDRYVETRQQARVLDRIRYGNPADKWTVRVPIPDGKAGTLETLKYMQAIVERDSRDPHVRQLAERIVRSCRGHDFDCEISVLFAYVRDQVTYRRDPLTTEYLQDTRRLQESGAGDCDCKVISLCSLLQSLGHRTRFAVIGSSKENLSHVYCEVLTKQQGWLALDPTNEQAAVGWEARAPVKTSYPALVN